MESSERTKAQKWPQQLVLIRHAHSQRNLSKETVRELASVWADSSLRNQDSALTPQGVEQALATGRHLSAHPRYDVVIASPYLRTRQTAERIISTIGYEPPIVIEERIREIEFGILDGLTALGIRETYPAELERRKKEGKYWYRPPGGESRPDVALRVHSFLGTLTREYAKARVLIVCHSVVVLIFRRLLERWHEEQYLEVEKEQDVKNCSLTSYLWNGERLALEHYNQIYY